MKVAFLLLIFCVWVYAWYAYGEHSVLNAIWFDKPYNCVVFTLYVSVCRFFLAENAYEKFEFIRFIFIKIVHV